MLCKIKTDGQRLVELKKMVDFLRLSLIFINIQLSNFFYVAKLINLMWLHLDPIQAFFAGKDNEQEPHMHYFFPAVRE